MAQNTVSPIAPSTNSFLQSLSNITQVLQTNATAVADAYGSFMDREAARKIALSQLYSPPSSIGTIAPNMSDDMRIRNYLAFGAVALIALGVGSIVLKKVF